MIKPLQIKSKIRMKANSKHCSLERNNLIVLAIFIFSIIVIGLLVWWLIFEIQTGTSDDKNHDGNIFAISVLLACIIGVNLILLMFRMIDYFRDRARISLDS